MHRRLNVDNHVAVSAVESSGNINASFDHLVGFAGNRNHIVIGQPSGNCRTLVVVVIQMPDIILKLPPILGFDRVQTHFYRIVIGRIDRKRRLCARIENGHKTALCVQALLRRTDPDRRRRRRSHRLAENIRDGTIDRYFVRRAAFFITLDNDIITGRIYL